MEFISIYVLEFHLQNKNKINETKKSVKFKEKKKSCISPLTSKKYNVIVYMYNRGGQMNVKV